jgi:hypothetical protein
MQLIYEHQTSYGLTMLANYTLSKCFSDQRTQGTATSAYRAQWLPGFGIKGDRGLCDTDAADVVHISGTYALPVGRNHTFLSNSNKVVDAVLGGWSVNYIYTYQSGEPLTVSCATATTSDFGCFAPVAPGANIYAGAHTTKQWLNPAAFSQPAAATQIWSVGLLCARWRTSASAGTGLVQPRRLRLQRVFRHRTDPSATPG